MIKISDYQKLNMEQLRKFAQVIHSIYGEDRQGGNIFDRVAITRDLDSAITQLILFEAYLYETRNSEKYEISNTFSNTFNQIKQSG